MESTRRSRSARPALLVALVTCLFVGRSAADMDDGLQANYIVLAQHALAIQEAETRYAVGSSDFCNGIECPSYRIDKSFTKIEGVERRIYPATKWISADVTAERHSDAVKTAMQKLQVYTNGANAEERELNLSVPPARYRMMPAAGPALKNQMVTSMFVPQKFQDNTPEPTEWGLRIEEQEPFVAYVAAYGGFDTQENIINATSKLSAELIAAGIPIKMDFFYNYIYDPPFELDSRYKEVLVVEAPGGKQRRQQLNIFDVEREPTVQTFRPVDEEEMDTFFHGNFLYGGREFRGDGNGRVEENEDGRWVESIDREDRDYDVYYHDVLDEYEQWLEEHQGELDADGEDVEYPMWPSSGFWWSSGDADANELGAASLYKEEADRMYLEDVEEEEGLLDYELDNFNEAWTQAEVDKMPTGEDPWNYGASGYRFGRDGDGEYTMDTTETVSEQKLSMEIDVDREYPMRPSSGFWWSVNTDAEEAERMFAEDGEEDEELLDADLSDFNEAWTQAEINRMPSDEDLLKDEAWIQAEMDRMPLDEVPVADEAWTQAEIDRMPSDKAALSYEDYSEDYSGEQDVIQTVSTFVIDLDVDIDYDITDEEYPMRPSEGFWWNDEDVDYDATKEDYPMKPSEGFWWSDEDAVQPSLKAAANFQPEAGSDTSLASALLAGKSAIIGRMMELLSEISFPGLDQQQKQQLQVSFPRKAYPLEEARPRQKTDLSELVQQAEQDKTNTELKITFEVVEESEVQPRAVQAQPAVAQKQPEKKVVDERQQEPAKGSSGSPLLGLLRIFNIGQ